MPLPVPVTDNRRYQALVDELVARIPSHTPEWTNFNDSDPGVTLIQLFAHITESLLYRANQIPERNRAKFLQLLGVPLAPAQEARGLVAFANERGPVESLVVPRGTELFAGALPFRTATSLDVLPLDAKFYVRRPIVSPSQELQDYYALLYASYGKPVPPVLTLYETVEVVAGADVDLAETVDHSLWVALLGRTQDNVPVKDRDGWDDLREKLAGRTLSLGMMPDQGADQIVARPGTPPALSDGLLRFELPSPGPIALDANGAPSPTYVRVTARADFDPLTQPGIIELALPPAAGLDLWSLDPLEAGVGDLPPIADAPDVAQRLVTWLRIRSGSTTDVKLNWVGINAAQVRQQLLVSAERQIDGDGTPDQVRQLRQSPVLAGSVAVISIDNEERHDWVAIDDIRAAGPELPIAGAPDMGDPVEVFSCDAEAGLVRFGDGFTGRRPKLGEAIYASYACTAGAEGNVGAGALKAGPSLAAGVTATNPVPTWGGADAESVTAAETQVPRFITHRDRLVTAEDFRAIAWRTPGVSIGRIEVLPAAHPDVAPITIGSAPGAVTLMVVPTRDPAYPDAPRANRPFLNTLCNYLDPRRLVTTELVLRGPDYVGIWISIGIEVAGGRSVAEVVEGVKTRIKAFLSPLPAPGTPMPQLPMLYGPDIDPALRGWPLARAVHARSLQAEVARAAGIVSVEDVLLAQGSGAAVESVDLSGLQLPEILGLSVVAGPPLPLDVLRGATATPTAGVGRMPVPILGGDLLMNVNSARFHLMLGKDDWSACTTVGPKPVTLARRWNDAPTDAGAPAFDSGQLTLLPLVEPIPPTPGEPLFTAADHRDAVADRNGNLYVVADDQRGLIVRSAGDAVVTPFWPLPASHHRSAPPAFTDAVPEIAAPETLAGLTVTTGDFLIAGAGNSLLRFDLVGGGPPERLRLPEGILVAALAATEDGGLWLRDASKPRLLKLDCDLRVEARPVPAEPAIFAPDGTDPAPGFTAEPVTIDITTVPAPAGLATFADGSVVLLDAPEKTPAGLFIVDPGATAIRPLIRLDFVASCFGALGRSGVPALLLADTDGNQARRVDLLQRGGRWEARASSATLPLRRFGGRGLVAIGNHAYYDSGATDPIWVQVVQVKHRRFADKAGFVTPIYDSAAPQCVWDRIRLDGCIPPGTQVLVEARAADDSATFATQADTGWVAQPALALSPSGTELPGKRAIAVAATDARIGKGSWGLLLQGITGRYAQLRITLLGDGRVTPHLRALRLWYPRFSYVERFLPGVYREEAVSASFLERFLANFEGLNTAIEDRIVTAETLFDPRTAPVEMLDWLASWYEVALDPVWDERRRRLFIANAARFFGWRGTIRGLQLALKLALDATITAADFVLDGPDCASPGTIRIVEAYRSRARVRSFPAPATAQTPGIRSLDSDWLPEEGAAGLWARWPEKPAPGGRFPLFPPAGKEAIWATLVQQQFGFVPSLGQSERARWLAFQTSIGVESPAADLPTATSEAWQRYAALPTHDRQAWQDFLAARYRTIDLLNTAHNSVWDDITLVPLPDYLPDTPSAARDWLMFEGQELPIDRAAHRFSVLLPRSRVDMDPDVEASQLALARRIVALEKPAHTIFDVRFYWAMNRVGEARLGLDSAIGQGSRAPELVPAAVLGRAYAGATFIGGPAAPPRGRSQIAC